MEIIYEDSEIIAINKPSDLSVTHDRGSSDSLIEILQKRRPDLKEILVIHQLDKDASGIMILAKNTDAQSRYCALFEESKVKKTYLAFVSGRPDELSGEIDAPLMQCKRDVRKMEVDLKKGREAKTAWQLLADFGRISLVAARPLTERTHQIRVHFQYSGFPLEIDPLYGTNEPIMLSTFKTNYRLGKFAEEKPLIDRLTLCAYELEIENHHFVAPIDKKFKATIKMLTKYNSQGPDAFINQQHFEQMLAAKPLSLDI